MTNETAQEPQQQAPVEGQEGVVADGQPEAPLVEEPRVKDKTKLGYLVFALGGLSTVFLVIAVLIMFISFIPGGNDETPEVKVDAPVKDLTDSGTTLGGEEEEIKQEILTPEDNTIYLGVVDGKPAIYLTNSYIREKFANGIEADDSLGQVIEEKPEEVDMILGPLPEVVGFSKLEDKSELLKIEDYEGLEISGVAVDEKSSLVYFGVNGIINTPTEEEHPNKVFVSDTLVMSDVFEYNSLTKKTRKVWSYNVGDPTLHKSHIGKAFVQDGQDGYLAMGIVECYECGPSNPTITTIVNLKSGDEESIGFGKEVSISAIDGLVDYREYDWVYGKDNVECPVREDCVYHNDGKNVTYKLSEERSIELP